MLSLKKIRLRNPLANHSQEDRNVMLICLGFAFVFWLLVKFSKDYTVVREVQLSYELPQGKAFANSPPQTVFVNLKAQGWFFLVAGISGKEYHLPYLVPDRTVYGLTAAKVRSDLEDLVNNKEVEITNLLFDGFRIVLENRVEKQVPLRAQYQLGMQEEYNLVTAVELFPDSVWVGGPQSIIDPIQFWLTDSLILDDLGQTYTGQLPIVTPEAGVSVSPASVQVTVPVERFTEKSIFVPVEILNPPPDSIRLFPDKALVKCVIGLGNYNSLRAEDFRLVADLSKSRLQEGKNSVPLELLTAPDYLHSVSLSPRATEFFVVKATESEEPVPSDENR
ncbi:MAG: CdaR family protein [Bacteroidota bacterium]